MVPTFIENHLIKKTDHIRKRQNKTSLEFTKNNTISWGLLGERFELNKSVIKHADWNVYTSNIIFFSMNFEHLISWSIIGMTDLQIFNIIMN